MTTAKRLGAVLIVAGLALLGFTAPAFATSGGDHKVLVCHNRAHNPVLVEVDKNSTKYQGHLMHRTQPQNLDKVEGIDGNAAAVRAFCTTEVEVPGPTVTVTGPATTVTVPGPTDTVTLPGDTVTVTGEPSTVTVPGPTSTVTGPDVTVTVPGNTSTTTLPDEVVTVPGETTTVTGPDVTNAVDSTKTVNVTGEVTTVTKTGTATQRTIVRDGKETLAYTGADIGAASLGVLFLGAGFLLLVVRRKTAH